MDVAHLLYRSAKRYPQRPLWISADGARTTYEDGAARVSALAHAILDRVEQRSRIAILSTNRPEGLEAFLGAIAAGCAAVTLNPRGHSSDYEHVLSDSGAGVVICEAGLTGRLEQLRPALSDVRHWVTFGGEVAGYEQFEAWIAGRPTSRPEVLIEPDDSAWLFYTSGTTGKPKGAIESHRNLLAMTRHFLLELGADLAPADIMLHLAPISHGSCSVALPHIAVGAANAFPCSLSFDPAAVCRIIERLGVTTTMLAPTMIRMLLDTGDIKQHNLSSLKTVVYGAAPMPFEDLKHALDVFGPVFVQFYGQAEAAATITCLPKSEHRVDGNDAQRKRLKSAGRETFSTRVRVVDPAGRALPAGQVGEIVVRGELVMPGYWGRPDATAETIRDGWLHTGDAGYLDEDGYLFITDRIKDMFISGGSNIYAREVEDVLLRMDGVAQVAVIGIPDPTWGDVVGAAIVRAENSTITEQDVIAYARANMASYKKPHHVWFPEALPTNANGKVLKRELRREYTAQVEAGSPRSSAPSGEALGE